MKNFRLKESKVFVTIMKNIVSTKTSQIVYVIDIKKGISIEYFSARRARRLLMLVFLQ